MKEIIELSTLWIIIRIVVMVVVALFFFIAGGEDFAIGTYWGVVSADIINIIFGKHKGNKLFFKRKKPKDKPLSNSQAREEQIKAGIKTCPKCKKIFSGRYYCPNCEKQFSIFSCPTCEAENEVESFEIAILLRIKGERMIKNVVKCPSCGKIHGGSKKGERFEPDGDTWNVNEVGIYKRNRY